MAKTIKRLIPYNYFSYGYTKEELFGTETKDEVVEESNSIPELPITPSYEINNKIEQIIDAHIIEEPASITDVIMEQVVSPDTFDSVIGELPDAEPSVHPEEDVEYTKEENAAVTETKVRSVRVKKSTTTTSDTSINTKKPAKKRTTKKKNQ